VVPDKATTWYFIRDLDENLEAATRWVHDCAKGAALMTQTRYKVKVLSAIHQRFYNCALARQIHENMKAVGKPRYTDKEKAFALALQKKAGFPPKGMDYPLALVDAEEDELRASSSDIGDVCLSVPTGQISIPVWVPGTPAHNWAATAVGATSIAHKGISAAAKAVALTVYDLLTDKRQLKKVKAEFNQLKSQRPYKSFLSPGVKPPLGFYKDMMAKHRNKLEEHGDKALVG
jgi:aminobenzoyl-glutamate utilization protein B